jgi:Outer membrane protein beta-barrel domain
MEHVDNDMDDLFRKAGDLYPLKTSESDWDAVLGKLRSETTGDQHTIPGIVTKGKSKKRRWGFLLLLIPIGLGSVLYFSHSIKNTSTELSARASKKKELHETDLSGYKANILKAQNNSGSSTDKNKSGNIKPVNNSMVTHAEVSLRHRVSINSSNSATVNSAYKTKETNSNKNDGLTTEVFSAIAASKSMAPPKGESTAPVSSKALPPAVTNEAAISSDPVTSKNVSEDSLSNKTADKKTTTKIKTNRGLYAGFMIGPDWTTIKFQDINQTGYSLGFIVGYRFNKKISVESGFYWDRKYYYSSGEYFNTAKLPIQPSAPFKSLDGYCNMFEIPIDMRYDFTSRNGHGFFAKIGFSAYIMHKEVYTFTKADDSTKGPFPYYNTGTNFLSVVQLSGGYEFSISRSNKIQFEPYLKIPLQKVGIGSLPISSAGIYFGIIHSFK